MCDVESGKRRVHSKCKEKGGIAPFRYSLRASLFISVPSVLSCCCLVTTSCPDSDSRDCSTPGSSVSHYLPEFAQTHVHRVGDAIQSSPSLLCPSPPALNLSKHQGLFQGVGSSHWVAKVLELQHQSFQWVFRVDFLRIDYFDLLAVQGTLKGLLQHHNLKASALLFFVLFPKARVPNPWARNKYWFTTW